MKISIVTVAFNNASTIADSLQSVASQKHSNIEHIIVDGASTDGTQQIVERFPHVAKFVSEPDSGIYDAMNKGIGMVTGEVVGILNADDVYQNNKVLSAGCRTS